MKNFIITAIGIDKPGIVSEMSAAINSNSGNVEESRMSKMGSDFAIIMLITVSEGWEKSLEVSLQSINDISISIKQTQNHSRVKNKKYKIYLNGAYNEGIVDILSKYLAEKLINISEMETSISSAPMSGTPLFSLNASVAIPKEVQEENVRQDLRTIAKKLGIEIFLEI